MTSEPKRSSYLVAEASPAEMAEQWRHVEARIEHGPGSRRWLPLSLALAGGTAAIVVLASSYRAAPERAWTSQGEPMPVALADGSRLELRPGSQVSLLGECTDEVRLGVLRGGARFEVRPDPGRRFQVTAASVDVVVTGTAFSVELESGQGAPRVSVERGEVEVHPRGETRLLARLHADESWPTRSAPSVAPAAPSVPAATPPVETRPEPASPAPALVAAPASASASRRPAPTDPRLLLEEANTARRIGDVERAAALLETLRGGRAP